MRPIFTITTKLVLIVALLCSGLSSARAAHIVGGEMTYVCMGDDPDNIGYRLYEFTIIAYRDCAGGGAEFDGLPGGASMHLSVYQGEGSNYSLVTYPGFDGIIFPDEPVVTDIIPGLTNPCVEIPSNLCVEKGVYTFTLGLPVIDETYHVVYQRCCRNNTITNIQNPDEAGSTYTAQINPIAQQQCNSTPVFNNFPEILICVNEPLEFDHSATDPDGDQLVYRFCNPLDGGSQMQVAPNPDAPPPFDEVTFVLPTYSAEAPLAGDPVVQIDATTGMITGTPNIQNQHVVSICVDEYRNGQLMSTVQRDFQFNITVCENLVNAALQDAVDDGNFYYVESCGDTTITIVNGSFDEAYIDNYLWEFNIPGTSQPLSWDQRDLTITFPAPGRYEGTMTLNPDADADCSDQANVVVIITPEVVPYFEFEYDTCVADPVSFFDLTSNPELTISEWLWDFGDGNTSTEPNPVHQYETAGSRLVTLTLTDSIGCSASYSDSVHWFPAPPIVIIDPSTSIGCPPEVVSFENLSSPTDSTYTLEWDFGNDSIGYDLNPSTTYWVPGTYEVSVAITSPIGCYVTDTFPDLIFVDSLPEADFVYSPPRGISNFEPEVAFTDLSFNAYFWDWKFVDGQDSSILKNPVYTFQDTGKQVVELTVTSFYGCTDTIRQAVDVVPKVTYFLPNAFTPNEDGKNEIFEGVGYFRGIRDYRMNIWNRYGQLIFESQDVETGWNGRYNNSGKYAPNGVYVYRVSFMGPRGEMEMYEGVATLIR